MSDDLASLPTLDFGPPSCGACWEYTDTYDGEVWQCDACGLSYTGTARAEYLDPTAEPCRAVCDDAWYQPGAHPVLTFACRPCALPEGHTSDHWHGCTMSARRPDHEVILTGEGGYQSARLVCNVPTGACHYVYDCDCERFYGEEMRNGVPAHRPDPWDDSTWHAGRIDPAARCRLEPWLDEADSLSYRIRLPVRATWEDDSYSFEAGEVES